MTNHRDLYASYVPMKVELAGFVTRWADWVENPSGSLIRFGTFRLAFDLVVVGFVAGFLTPLESRSA